MNLLAAMVALLRDIAVLAAAVSVARWAWDRHLDRPRRLDAEARDAIDAERRAVDLRRWGDRIEGMLAGISAKLDGVLARSREDDERAALEARVHAALHATNDPFLTLAEIRAAIDSDARTGTARPTAATGDAMLRRALLGLIASGAVAQLDHDRYFIATDFEAEEASPTHVDGASPPQ